MAHNHISKNSFSPVSQQQQQSKIWENWNEKRKREKLKEWRKLLWKFEINYKSAVYLSSALISSCGIICPLWPCHIRIQMEILKLKMLEKGNPYFHAFQMRWFCDAVSFRCNLDHRYITEFSWMKSIDEESSTIVSFREMAFISPIAIPATAATSLDEFMISSYQRFRRGKMFERQLIKKILPFAKNEENDEGIHEENHKNFHPLKSSSRAMICVFRTDMMTLSIIFFLSLVNTRKMFYS